MIDLNKLKFAQELCAKTANLHWFSINFSCLLDTPDGCFYTLSSLDEPDIDFDTIDELLERLQELTQPKPKFVVGQEVWIIRNDQPIIAEVWAIYGDRYHLGYAEGRAYIEEKHIHASKMEVIQAEIDYWQSLKDDSISIDSIDIKWHWQRAADQLLTNKEPSCLIYSTKEEAEAKPCQHESDDTIRVKNPENSTAGIEFLEKPYKCIKCGEFYR